MKTFLRIVGLLYLIIFFHLTLNAQSNEREYQYALIEAVKQKNLGNIPGAIELYKMVLRANDSVAVAHYELGNLLILTGNSADAEFHLSYAFNADKSNQWYFQSFIDVLISNEKFNYALGIIDEVNKIDGEKPEYIFRKADIYFRKGKVRKAIRTLEYIERNYGYSTKITMLKANIYESEGWDRKAMKEVEEIVSLFPESIEYKIVAAELAAKMKKEDLAAKYYKEVFLLDSLNIFALTNLTDYYREQENLSQSFKYLNISFLSDDISYEKKMTIFSYYITNKEVRNNYSEELEGILKTLLFKYPDKREIHLFAADFYIQNSDYDKALDNLLPVLNENEDDYEVWRQGILLANATGSANKVISLADQAINKYPDSVNFFLYKGMAEFDQDMFYEVVETFDSDVQKLIQRKEVLIQVNTLLAESYNRIGNYRLSDSLFTEVIAIDSNNYMVLNNFSYYLSLRGDSLELAERLSYLTVVNNPENSVYLDTYAWILYKLKDYEQADIYIRKALNKGGSSDPEVNEHAGDIQLSLDNKELAEKFYQSAIDLGGEKLRLERKIKLLYKDP